MGARGRIRVAAKKLADKRRRESKLEILPLTDLPGQPRKRLDIVLAQRTLHCDVRPPGSPHALTHAPVEILPKLVLTRRKINPYRLGIASCFGRSGRFLPTVRDHQ